MKNLEPSDVLFEIIHTDKIGVIGVAVTPIRIWELTSHIAILYKYDDFIEVFKKINLVKISPSVYEHTGLFTESELENAMLQYGFKKQSNFSLYIDIKFSYNGLNDEEIIKILNGN